VDEVKHRTSDLYELRDRDSKNERDEKRAKRGSVFKEQKTYCHRKEIYKVLLKLSIILLKRTYENP